MALRRGVGLLIEGFKSDTYRLQRHLFALGDDGAKELMQRHETKRTKRVMATAGPLPLVRSGDENTGTAAQPLLERARDPFANAAAALPDNTVTLYADCLPENTVLTFVRYRAVRALYNRNAQGVGGRRRAGSAGLDDRNLLGTEDVDERLNFVSEKEGFVETLRQQLAPEDCLLTYSPRDSGYPIDSCGGYAAAQISTNDALYKVYQRCLDANIVTPRTQMHLQVLIRGYQRGRGGVFHALKENPHLLRLVDVQDCTHALSRPQMRRRNREEEAQEAEGE